MTRFTVGDKVRSLVTAQGMKEGQQYIVREVLVTSTFLGDIVNYRLELDAPVYRTVCVGNGHLLLTKVG